MRVKKKSRNRKAVKFYSTCFGFREPYKVLIDGTFVHHLLTQRLLPADEALRDLLSASRTPALFISKCVLAELRRLGKTHAEAFDAANFLATTKCEHKKVVSAVNCVLSLVGDNNPEHFFVATQDADLREKLREIPGVLVIYGLKNSLFIEQPSVQQRKFAQLDEEKRLNMDISEYKKLLKAASEGKATDDVNGSGGEQLNRPISSLVKNALGVAEKPKFKKDRPKGPNPLSCKKKKKKPQSSGVQNQGAKADGESFRKRVQKRKKSHFIQTALHLGGASSRRHFIQAALHPGGTSSRRRFIQAALHAGYHPGGTSSRLSSRRRFIQPTMAALACLCRGFRALRSSPFRVLVGSADHQVTSIPHVMSASDPESCYIVSRHGISTFPIERFIPIKSFLKEYPIFNDVPYDRLVVTVDTRKPYITSEKGRKWIRSGYILPHLCELQSLSLLNPFDEDNVGILEGCDVLCFKRLFVASKTAVVDPKSLVRNSSFTTFFKGLVKDEYGCLSFLPKGLEIAMDVADSEPLNVKEIIYHPEFMPDHILSILFMEYWRLVRMELPTHGDDDVALEIMKYVHSGLGGSVVSECCVSHDLMRLVSVSLSS